MNNEVYTIKDVANYFKVSERTVLLWIKTKKIKSIKVGGARRITKEEMQRLVKGGE